jgi:type VI secretion system protein ImpJ
MTWFSKVAWREGLFLQPHHFQQSDRYHEKLLDLRTRHLSPYPWGLTDIAVNRDRLLQGKFELTRVSGIMADGMPFDAPTSGPLPLPLEVPEGSEGRGIWLVLPDSQINGLDLALRESTSATRYVLGSETVADSNAAMRSERLIETAEPRLTLELRDDPKPGFQCLCLTRVLEVRDRVVVVDDTFTPPVMLLRSHPVPLGWLDRVIGWVETRREMLARYAADPSAGGGLQDADYLLLLVLNRQINVLRHLRRSRDVHPERLYEEMLRLAGELASFDQDRRLAPDYAAYDHADLESCIEPMLRDIQRLLSRDVGRATRLTLDPRGQNAFVAQVMDPNLFRDATFVVEVASSLSPTIVQQQFPGLFKIAPLTRMLDIVNNNLPGIELIHVPTPPRQIRSVSRNVYFILQKSSPFWPEFSKSPAIGLHFSGNWPDLKLELWATVEARG